MSAKQAKLNHGDVTTTEVRFTTIHSDLHDKLELLPFRQQVILVGAQLCKLPRIAKSYTLA
jgi:hypothetical protein